MVDSSYGEVPLAGKRPLGGIRLVIGTRCLAGGCPAASDFLLLRQKKVTKEKATPLRHPFGAGLG